MAERSMVTGQRTTGLDAPPPPRRADAPAAPWAESSLPPWSDSSVSDWSDVVLLQWRTACLDGEGDHAQPFRDPEATALLRAVLACVANPHALAVADRRLLEVASRDWARTIRPLPVMVARFASLRRVLEESCPADAVAKLAEVLDTVGTLATQAALAELEDAALTDALTGAGNRRALEQAAMVALAEAGRTGNPLSVALIDLDGLKAINDTQGHVAGDAALESLAEVMRSSFRATDQLFRIGGDEFVVLLPLAGERAVAELMARARQLGAPGFSWGSATVPGDGTALQSLLAAADARLYAQRRSSGYARAPGGGRRAGSGTPSPRWAQHPRRHLGRSLLVAAGSAAAVAVIALVLGTGGKAPHPVESLLPGAGSAPGTSAPPGAGSGAGAHRGGGSGSGSTGSGSAGSGTSGGQTGSTGSASSSTGTTPSGTTAAPGTTTTTAPGVTIPTTTIPGTSGGGAIVPPIGPSPTSTTTTTTAPPSGSGGLLGNVGSLLGGSTTGSTTTTTSAGLIGGLLG